MTWQPPSNQPPGWGTPPGYPPAYPAGQSSAGPAAGRVYGSFGRRLGGFAIDLVIYLVVSIIALFVIFGSTLTSYATAVENAQNNGLPKPALVLPSGGKLIYVICLFIFAVLYMGVLVAVWGSTVGERAVGLRVVPTEDATKRLPIERALLRALPFWAASLLAFIPGVSDIIDLLLFLALLWVAWDPRKQGLHDKLGRAFVLKDALLPPSAYGQPAYPYAHPPASPYAPPGSLRYPGQYPPQAPTGYPPQAPTDYPPQAPTEYPPQSPPPPAAQ